MRSEEICAFCNKNTTLRESHVLPAFAFRWLRDRSGTGYIRNTSNPNRRVQDGLKLKWLCDICESHFSQFESTFAIKLFHPWHHGLRCLAYDKWLLKFCVSISWRVLKFSRSLNTKNYYSLAQKELMDQADIVWRNFLIDKEPHPGNFEQHLLIFDITKRTMPINSPPNYNRYMAGAIKFEIIGSDRSLMTVAKIGPFIIIGLIQKDSFRWKNTRVSVRHGELKHTDVFVIPAELSDLFCEQAALANNAFQNMSSAQCKKIENHITQNAEKFVNSAQFEAILADIEMFGIQAVIRDSSA